MNPRELVRALRAGLMILWPALTIAATSTFGQTFDGVGRATWAMVATLAFAAGFTALLNRLKANIETANAGGTPIGKLPPLWLVVSSHMSGSGLAGLCGFLMAEHFGMPGFMEALFIIACSYGGARFVEQVAEGAVKATLDRLSLLFGVKKE